MPFNPTKDKVDLVRGVGKGARARVPLSTRVAGHEPLVKIALVAFASSGAVSAGKVWGLSQSREDRELPCLETVWVETRQILEGGMIGRLRRLARSNL